MRIRTSAARAAGSVLVPLIALGATACSSSASGGSGAAGSGAQPAAVAGAGSGAGKTLTVWYMDGDLTDAAQKAIDDKFTAATGAKVKVEIQQWDGINTKIATALAQDNPPDVIEIGNTDVPLFAASSGLTDITSALPQLQNGQQLAARAWRARPPSTASSYAAPLFAGNRAVIYNKKIWAAAGITAVPTTFSAADRGPGRHQGEEHRAGLLSVLLPGPLLVRRAAVRLGRRRPDWPPKSSGKWSGALESPQAQQGLTAWKNFVGKYSSAASQDVDTTAPDFNTLFAQGKTATILNSNVNKILKVDPSLKDQIGTFPFPSATDGKTQPVFLGGSDLAVAAKSKNQALALAYLKTAADPAVQASAIVGIDHWIPASSEVIDQTISTLPDVSKAFFTAAKTSVATPAVAGWATVESDKSINDFFADIATGRKSPADAAKTLDAHLSQALNAPAQ